MDEALIAPCGMNCAVCVSYLAMKNDLNRQGFKRVYCEGCIPRGKYCLHMGDRCEALRLGLVRFCYECKEFPCKRLKALDKRYRTKYHLSMIENLQFIKEHGIEEFLRKEKEKWSCPECGGAICCHNGLCLSCKADKLRKNKKYRWDKE
ncbi:MAG: DUF3795 domain-containing protein [Clostridia bacterium]|nr:DUF3795 domain-containing protein [Clostridia bacterium]